MALLEAWGYDKDGFFTKHLPLDKTYIDPEQSRVEGKIVVAPPANSTTVEVLPPLKGHWPKFDPITQEWRYVKDHRGREDYDRNGQKFVISRIGQVHSGRPEPPKNLWSPRWSESKEKWIRRWENSKSKEREVEDRWVNPGKPKKMKIMKMEKYNAHLHGKAISILTPRMRIFFIEKLLEERTDMSSDMIAFLEEEKIALQSEVDEKVEKLAEAEVHH
jgi:hypothetical protein